MSDPVLAVNGVYKRFGGIEAVAGVTLTLPARGIHALIGPNGAGKTTLLALLGGELLPDAGSVTLAGADITALPMARRARRGVARSFQVTAVFDEYTVAENVALGVQARARHHFRFWRNAARDPALNEPTIALLERLDLSALARRRAGELAHGYRRQLELAMALATEPRVLLLDEPMAGLGAGETESLTRLLAGLGETHAVLLVEHDMDVVFRLAHRITVMVSGAVLTHGDPASVRGDPAVQRAYLADVAAC